MRRPAMALNGHVSVKIPAHEHEGVGQPNTLSVCDAVPWF
jgi:hypothetical protein